MNILKDALLKITNLDTEVDKLDLKIEGLEEQVDDLKSEDSKNKGAIRRCIAEISIINKKGAFGLEK